MANVKPVKPNRIVFLLKKQLHEFNNRQIKNEFSCYLHKYSDKSQYPGFV